MLFKPFDYAIQFFRHGEYLVINANEILVRRSRSGLLILVWAWVALFHTSAFSASPDKVRLQLKWYHQFQFAGYYAAQSKGYYKDEGLDVEIIEGAPDKPPDKMVLENKAEFGVDDGADLVFRRLQGSSVVAVAAIFQHSPTVIISKQSTGVRHPSDLIGRKVMITLEQSSAQILAMFRREGVKVKSTYDEEPVLFAPHSWNVEDLIEERVDAMTAYLTEIPNFKRRYGFVPAVLNPFDYGIDFYGDTLFTSNEFLKAQPQVVERFRRASLKGWQFAMVNPEAIADQILQLTSTRQNKPDRQVLLDEAQAMDSIVLSKLVEMGNMNAGRWEQMAKTYEELGMVNSISNLEGFTYEIDAQRREIQRELRLLGVIALGITLLAVGSLVWARLLRSRVILRTRELTDEIAQRKQIEHELRDSKALTEAIVENIPLMIFVKDAAELRFVAFNRAGEELIGYERKDILGKSNLDLFPPKQAAQFMAEDREVLDGDTQVLDVPEESIQTVKRGLRLVHTRNVCIRGGDGHTKYLLGISEDITERKLAEIDRRDQHELLQVILSTALDGYWLADAQGRLLDVNDAVCAMLGYSKQEALCLRVSDIDVVESQEEIENRSERMQLHGGDKFETRYRRKDGSIVQVEVSIRYLPLKSAFSVFIRDITQRKLTEAKLHLAASVFEHAREGIVITDVLGAIVDINETFTHITGYSRAEAVGQNPRILKSGRQDAVFYEAMWEALTVQGHWGGEIWNRRKNGEVYAELLTISAVRDAHGDTQQYVGLFSDITGIKEYQRQLEHIAHFDALTNLPNRLLLADRLQQAMAQAVRRGQKVAVAYLDLDGFKGVNDRYGHDMGDQLLIHLATAMKTTLREGDTLARLGGDEFVAVLIDLEGIEGCVPMLTRLLEAAAAPVPLGDVLLQGSASIGVSFYPQAHDMEADQLLRQADQAMYQAKLAGKNRYHVFDAAHDSSLRVHHESLERIRLALVQGEFVLHYQPKVNMHSGQVIGAEALIRWQHPEKGLLPPATFLPVIEDHQLAVEVGEWVIDSALSQIEVWNASGLNLAVSVNIGARQLQQTNFVERLQIVLAKHPQVSPTSLELEVLETSALADMEQVSQVIETCHQMGVKFALDDFGTGYSSLTYLKRLRVALLKIDQSFVRDMLDDPDDLAILKGVIGLAAAFKREVIAEGVETVAHGTALLHLGCDLAQGYGIARPMPPEQMSDWVAAWQPDAAWCAVPNPSEPV
jgi:diguanylate cyclase (GGDEF)-like protein/PAS domain S-box-containing protein